MTYELSSEVTKILDDLARRFGLAIDWTSQNVMPYVAELLGKFVSYKIAINIIPVVIFVIMFGVNIWFWRKLYRSLVQAKKDNKPNMFVDVDKIFGYYTFEANNLSYTIGAIIVIISLLSTFIFFGSVSELLKLIYIPELYIVEYISQYM